MRGRPGKPVALIADDDEAGRLLLAAAASTIGLDALDFGNGAAAVEAARGREVAIVLLDVDMPDMDGYSVCRMLRAEARFATVPIVMVTGHENSDAIERAFEAGATDFIAKPVNWALLPHRLEYILRNAAQMQALAERELQVRTLIQALPDRLWMLAPHGELRWSPQHEAPRAASRADEEIDHPFGSLPEQQRNRALTALRATSEDGRPRRIELREAQPNGAELTSELRFSRCESGEVVVIRQDTTERTAAAARIERLAYFDALTGLPNRQWCLDTAEHLIAEAVPLKESVAIIFIDLNGFKRINDTFGHPAGDGVLRQVAERLGETLARYTSMSEACLSRFGGDEFVFLVRHAEAKTLATSIATACARALDQPILHSGLELYATPSIGLAVFPHDGADVATVLKHADTAMYHAKSAGSSELCAYSPAMSGRLRDWLMLENKLRRAVREELLSLHFQPKFLLSSLEVSGVEALARWLDPDFGDIPPQRFIEIAEEGGLIMELGSWVVRAACRQLRAWIDQGLSIPVAINISAKELLHGDPARLIETETAAAGVPPELVEVEITESLIVRDSAQVRAALDRLRSLGCRIALDDFGTGFSSLAYITRFPPDRIKIDKSFVRHVDRSRKEAAIASAILSLGESLNIAVTAEGVERSGQLEWLRQRGCREGQGYLLSRPMPAADLYRRLSAGQSSDTVRLLRMAR